MSNEKDDISTKGPDSPKSRIFISYSSRDADTADRLAKLCEQLGAETWIDRDDIKPGENWRNKLEEAVQSCDTFLILVSSAALSNSEWCSREWSAICERNWTKPRVRVIPIRLDEAEVPAFLRHRRALDGHDRSKLVECVEEIADYPTVDPDAKLDPLRRRSARNFRRDFGHF
jgi:TIR domain-containing protein